MVITHNFSIFSTVDGKNHTPSFIDWRNIATNVRFTFYDLTNHIVVELNI